MSLDPRTRALLDRARGGFEPTARDTAAAEAALIAVIGAGGAGVATAAGGGAAKLSAMGSVTLAKALAGVPLVSGAIGGALAVTRSPPQESKASAPVAASSSAVAISLPVAPSAPVAVEEPIETLSPPMPTATSRRAPQVPAPRAEPRAAQPQVASTLSEELAIVREGTSRLHAGNAVGALASFDSHAETFPRGVLEEERCAGRVLALCALGRKSDAHPRIVRRRVVRSRDRVRASTHQS
jgi:hypothetical protein